MKEKSATSFSAPRLHGVFNGLSAVLLVTGCLLAVNVSRAEVVEEPVPAAGIVVQVDIPYFDEGSTNDYVREQCKLDLYLPQNVDKPFPLLVWFHGGGLQGGSKTNSLTAKLAMNFALKGVGVAVPEYRFSPKVTFPAYVEDAAKSVKWAVDHASELGAATNVFVGGHSAGGYLTSLLAMDSRYFAAVGVDTNNIAGYISMSGQTMTHFTVAAERGLGKNVITADDAAPIRHLASATPPILLLIGDKDWPARLQENQYFLAALQQVGHNPNVRLIVAEDRDHGSILKKATVDGDPVGTAMLDFIRSGKLPKSDTETPAPVDGR